MSIWRTPSEMWTIIAADEKVTIEEAKASFCDRCNAGKFRMRCIQVRRDSWGKEIEPEKEIEVIFPRITPASFSADGSHTNRLKG
jgi:hypothetical protein